MALYAFDGTWNIDEIEEDRETNEEGVGTEACIPTWAADTVWGWAVSPCAGCCGEPRNAGFRLTRSGWPALSPAAILPPRSRRISIPIRTPQRTILPGDRVHESVTPRGTMGGVVHLDHPAGVTVVRG